MAQFRRRQEADLFRISQALQQRAQEAQQLEATRENELRYTLAMQRQAITEAVFAGHLDTAALPDPDLVIRTSGETRTSNFLPWQAAYAEYDFTPTLWPDFNPAALAAILAQFSGRERRFGGVKG